jgi:anti-sigma factor RsiW
MNITRDVITDLLPAYDAGEASADTRSLVDAYLAQDPVFAALVAEGRRTDGRLRSTAAPPADGVERESLQRTRKLLRERTWTVALAVLFTGMPFTFAFDSHGITFFMLRDQPGAALFLVSAAFLWVRYFRVQRRLRPTAL